MRAIVAESNVVTRVALRRILERSGYSVEELRDELAAVSLLHQEEAPELAFLALDTILVGFEEVCRSIREAKPDVYIVALVPESRRIEVPTVLDAGADDFMIKPMSLQEAEARVRVIRRVIERTNGDLQPEQVEEPRRKTRSVDKLLSELTSPGVLTDVFSQMGLEPVMQIRPDEIGPAAFSVWAPTLILHQESGRWMNVRIDVDEINAPILFGAVERYGEFSEDRLLRVMKDLMGLTEDVIRTWAERSSGTQLFVPLAPVARPSQEIPHPAKLAGGFADHKQLGLRLKDELNLLMSLSIEPVPLEEPVIGKIRTVDVLARDVQSSEYKIMLLRAGTMLNEDYIRKIQAFVHSRNLSQKIAVYRPPGGTTAFIASLSLDVYA